MCAFQACNDDTEETLSYLVGTWYGSGEEEGSHAASVEGTLTFNSDGTGCLKTSYKTDGYSSESNYDFTYSVDGKTVQCEGNVTRVDSNDKNDTGETKPWTDNNTFTYNDGILTGGPYRNIVKSYSKN